MQPKSEGEKLEGKVAYLWTKIQPIPAPPQISGLTKAETSTRGQIQPLNTPQRLVRQLVQRSLKKHTRNTAAGLNWFSTLNLYLVKRNSFTFWRSHFSSNKIIEMKAEVIFYGGYIPDYLCGRKFYYIWRQD